jgi:hypothetical protein
MSLAPLYTYPPLGLSIISDPQAGSYGGGGDSRSGTTVGARTGIKTHYNNMIYYNNIIIYLII